MKKLLLFLGIVTIILTGCQRKSVVHHDCIWVFEIENKTDSEVTYSSEKSEIVILPGDTKEIYRYGNSDAYNQETLSDIYNLDFPMVDPSHRLKVNDIVLPETIWLRRLWDFESKEPLRASYKLILTNELIEFLSSTEE